MPSSELAAHGVAVEARQQDVEHDRRIGTSLARHSPSGPVWATVDLEALGAQAAGDRLGRRTSSSITSTRLRVCSFGADGTPSQRPQRRSPSLRRVHRHVASPPLIRDHGGANGRRRQQRRPPAAGHRRGRPTGSSGSTSDQEVGDRRTATAGTDRTATSTASSDRSIPRKPCWPSPSACATTASTCRPAVPGGGRGGIIDRHADGDRGRVRGSRRRSASRSSRRRERDRDRSRAGGRDARAAARVHRVHARARHRHARPAVRRRRRLRRPSGSRGRRPAEDADFEAAAEACGRSPVFVGSRPPRPAGRTDCALAARRGRAWSSPPSLRRGVAAWPRRRRRHGSATSRRRPNGNVVERGAPGPRPHRGARRHQSATATPRRSCSPARDADRPPRAGRRDRAGDVVAEVDGEPVIALHGHVPVVARLVPGVDDGKDVLPSSTCWPRWAMRRRTTSRSTTTGRRRRPRRSRTSRRITARTTTADRPRRDRVPRRRRARRRRRHGVLGQPASEAGIRSRRRSSR